jgi:ergothioneine biosynthesis protein EgtB
MTDAQDSAAAGPVADFRCAPPVRLEALMTQLRTELMRVWHAYRIALPAHMDIRYAPELNPPRWELGHIGWFEDHWIGRNPLRLRGNRADPEVARAAPLPRASDRLYDSSRVAHTRRWHLDLPDGETTVRQVQAIRARTLELLRRCADDDIELYFYRLSLAHEAMHLEAWIYMAQTLALDLRGCGLMLQPRPQQPHGELEVDTQPFVQGCAEPGFAFDNERHAHEVRLEAFVIDAVPVTWERYLPFVQDRGYDDARWWSAEGWAWRQRQRADKPRHLMREGDAWQRAVFGQWVDLDPAEPALHLTAHEAAAWCRWAGRRLPTESEWECAAVTRGDAFRWGDVWEWTSSAFGPYPGFRAHPYRDYSQPWFDGRPVLRGASFATRPTMRHPRYRNYFVAERDDIFAGFRSCRA